MKWDPTGESSEKQKKNEPSGNWTGADRENATPLASMNYVSTQKRNRETQMFVGVIYLRERVMPRAEPSAARWGWQICTWGQRSGGRVLDNLTGRDWSLPGRHRLEERTKTVSHP